MVALRRAKALVQAGGEVVLIAPLIEPELSALPIQIHQRAYQTSDLAGARLVVVASNDATVNEAVAREACANGVLVNRADAPESGDFTVMASAELGPITLAVDSGSTSATAAATIRDELCDALDPHWPKLIELAKPWRAIIQSRYPDANKRLPKLKQLCGPHARGILTEQGEEPLQAYYDALAKGEEQD